jgi:serine/threonine protein kinase
MVHPNILRFYGIYRSSESEPYIVTELMPLGNLRDLLRKRREDVSIWELLQMAKDVAAGLTYMKSHKIIHRDLSARNLLVTSCL